MTIGFRAKVFFLLSQRGWCKGMCTGTLFQQQGTLVHDFFILQHVFSNQDPNANGKGGTHDEYGKCQVKD